MSDEPDRRQTLPTSEREIVRAEVAWALRPMIEDARHYYGVIEDDDIVRIDFDGPQPIVREGRLCFARSPNTALTVDDLEPVEDEVKP